MAKRTPDSELKEQLRVELNNAQGRVNKAINDLEKAESAYQLLEDLYKRYNRLGLER